MHYAVWPDPVTGKQRKKSLRTSDPAKAEIKLKNFNRDLAGGKVKPIAPRITSLLSDFRIKFLEYAEHQVDKDEIRPATYNLYKVALDKAVEAWGPDKNLLRLHKKDIEFYQDFIARPPAKTADEKKKPKALAKTTVNKNFRHLKGALKKGMEWQVVNKDLYFPRQWKNTQEIRYFTTEELVKLATHITEKNPAFADLVMLAAYSGLRSGEIVRLTARDIDNPKGFIRVSAEQKNRSVSRIPINSKMRRILDRHSHDIGPLFRWKRVDHISATFRAFADAAGFPDHRFHDLRHTYGAHLVMAGTDIRKVQQLMRHRSIESTMVYTNLHPVDLVEAAESVDYGEAADYGTR